MNEPILRRYPLLQTGIGRIFFILIAMMTGSACLMAEEEPASVSVLADSSPQYRQIWLPPVYGPPVFVPGPVSTVTYYAPPVYPGNYPPVVVQGPVIVRNPWRPFLRTFIP